MSTSLFRMMRAGVIERLARGLYVCAGQQVDAQTVASALAQKTGERVGLAPSGGAMICWWRDIYDLMVLTRDHGYTLDDIFAAIDAHQPIRNKDPEHFKSVVTGLIPVEKNDEGFDSIHLNVKMDDIFKHFKKLINDHEIRAVQQMRPRP